jgi:hypothetical protein
MRVTAEPYGLGRNKATIKMNGNDSAHTTGNSSSQQKSRRKNLATNANAASKNVPKNLTSDDR